MTALRMLSLALIGALMLGAVLLPPASRSVAQEGPEEWQPGAPLGWNLKALSAEQQQRMLRFSTFVNEKVPEAYLKAENGVGYTTKAIAAGGPIYASHCAKCHGATGLGNGALAHALSPSPALLASMIQQPIAIDQYLLWTISEGGKPFGTAMPAFKTELTQDEIWQVVAYLRAGFPAVEDEGGPKASPAAPATTDEPSPAPKPKG
ncbi:MAG: cytochrome c [Methyloceanibacter sp.]|jgi:mono/diheme cytochrome c family protein|nr:cytochrome c [Methyloceanibacter sp.]